jgi:hypothetical protein
MILALLKMGFSYGEVLNMPEHEAHEYLEAYAEMIDEKNEDSSPADKPKKYLVRRG